MGVSRRNEQLDFICRECPIIDDCSEESLYCTFRWLTNPNKAQRQIMKLLGTPVREEQRGKRRARLPKIVQPVVPMLRLVPEPEPELPAIDAIPVIDCAKCEKEVTVGLATAEGHCPQCAVLLRGDGLPAELKEPMNYSPEYLKFVEVTLQGGVMWQQGAHRGEAHDALV